MEQAQEETVEAVKTNFARIRQGVEQHDYTEVETLLQEQRQLLEHLPQDVNSSLTLVNEAQELLRWSLSMVALQRQTYTQSLSTILHLKQLDSGYMPGAVCSSDFVSYTG